jgi:hypothetical protein
MIPSSDSGIAALIHRSRYLRVCGAGQPALSKAMIYFKAIEPGG